MHNTEQTASNMKNGLMTQNISYSIIEERKDLSHAFEYSILRKNEVPCYKNVCILSGRKRQHELTSSGTSSGVSNTASRAYTLAISSMPPLGSLQFLQEKPALSVQILREGNFRTISFMYMLALLFDWTQISTYTLDSSNFPLRKLVSKMLRA
jgi:hypothetical protein